MPLEGDSFEKLRDLILDAFDQQDLVQLVRFRLGKNLYDEVAENQGYGMVVFEFIGRLEKQGLLTRFLQEAIKARPDRSDLADNIRKICPDVDRAVPTSQEVAGKVDNAVRTVAQRLPEEGVRKLVRDSAQTLRGLSEEIALLRGYKSLHDSLHTLQMQILRRLTISARRLASDPASAEDLGDCRTGIQTAVVQISSAIAALPVVPPSLRKWEEDWLERLRQVDKLAEDAYSGSVPMLGLQSAQLLRRILRHEPARIDRYLRITAEGIALVGLSNLFDEAAKLSQGGPDEKAFRDGQQAAQILISRLQALVTQHSRWQEIDGQLWDADHYMPSGPSDDTSDFTAFWTSLRDQVLALTATDPSNALSKTLADACNNIEGLRQAPEPDWKKICNAYTAFRNNAVVFFFRIDTDLKSLADEIARIGDSLQSLLNGI